MYRLQLSPNKVFTYNSHLDTLQFQKKDSPALSNEQRTKHLVELVSRRQKVSRSERPLYTAFMMKLAQSYFSLRVALGSLEAVRGTAGDKAEVSECLQDVWGRNIKARLCPLMEGS